MFSFYFPYNFDHVLIYIICKFHASTTFNWFFFLSQKSASRMQIFAEVCPWKLPQVLHIGYMIYFYYQNGF